MSARVDRTALETKFSEGFTVYDALTDQEFNYHDSGVMIPANSLRMLWLGNHYE